MSLTARTGLVLSVLCASACVFAHSASSGVSLPGKAPRPLPGHPSSGRIHTGSVPTGEIASGVIGGSVHVAPLQSHPHGRGYATWVTDWWRWALETDASENPLLDPNSGNCASGEQPARVRFLGGTFT